MSSWTKTLYLVFILLIVGCGGKDKTELTIPEPVPPPVSEEPPNEPELPLPDNRYADSYAVLLIGNSHVTSNNLGGIIKALIKVGTNKETYIEISPGMGYLDERLTNDITQTTLTSREWSHVILQAQKYSTTGQRFYSTEAAEIWVERVKEQAATPILFPEHPRAGNTKEGMRVFNIHQGIAQRRAACVSPIGPAWDKASLVLPAGVLHVSDGNHAALTGSLLTALIFYEVITGELAEQLPYINSIKVAEDVQQQLGQIASATIQQYAPCSY